jgi:hypothetical protein
VSSRWFLLFHLKFPIHFWCHAFNYPLFLIIFIYGNGQSVPVNTERIWGIGGIVPFKLKFGCRWFWRSTSSSRRFIPDEWALGTHWIECWMGPRVCLVSVERRKVSSTGNRTTIARFYKP